MTHQMLRPLELKKQVVTGLAWSAFQSIGLKAVSLVVFTLLARLLAPNEMGLFATALAILAFISLFIDQGLSEAIVQRSSISDAQVRAVFFINTIIAIAFVLLLVGLAGPISRAMKMAELENILRLSGLSTLISAASFSQAAVLRRSFQYKWIAITSFIAYTISGIVAVIMAYHQFGVWSLVAQSIIAATITTTLLWNKGQITLRGSANFKEAADLVQYGMHRLAASIVDFASSRYIEFFIATHIGTIAIGLYSVGIRLQQSLMQAMSSAVLDVAHNGFSRLNGDIPGLRAAYCKAITLTAASAVPLLMMTSCLASEIILTLFGHRYATSAIVLQTMSLLGAIQVLQYYNGTILNAIGKPSQTFMILVARTATTIAALHIFSNHDLDSVVMTFLLSQTITAPLSFEVTRRHLKSSHAKLILAIIPYISAAAAAYGVTSMARLHVAEHNLPAPLQLVTLGLIYALIYAMFIAIFNRANFIALCKSINPNKR